MRPEKSQTGGRPKKRSKRNEIIYITEDKTVKTQQTNYYDGHNSGQNIHNAANKLKDTIFSCITNRLGEIFFDFAPVCA